MLVPKVIANRVLHLAGLDHSHKALVRASPHRPALCAAVAATKTRLVRGQLARLA